MMHGQRVEIENKGNVFKGLITKVVNSTSCVVSWNYRRGREEYKYNVLYSKEQVDKGRVRYEGISIK